MFKRSKGRHARKSPGRRRLAGPRWVGPLFAFEALMITLSAKRELDAVTRTQLAEVAQGPAL